MKIAISRIRHHLLLIGVIFLAYAPFLDVRMIRTTGDEKVYIAQALEMQSLGNWFVQSLNGQPDYYKGPMHYLLMRLGLKVFGYSLWSALYMNLLFCILGAVALAEVVRRTFPEKKHWPFWIGAFFAFNVGIFGHFFASQMEVEVAGFFALGFYFLWRGKRWDDLIFWILAGLVGWVKSPLHSVLLGVTAPLFWLIRGELLARLKDWKTWFFGACGVLVCLAGYAPAFLLDREHFIQFYVRRENLDKPPNGGPWWQALLPMVSYYLIPWMTLAILSYAEQIYQWIAKRRWNPAHSDSERKFLFLALSMFLPTTLFFIFHPYRGENYALPIVGSVGCLILLFLKSGTGRWLRVRNWILGLTSLPILAVPIALQAISTRFHLSIEIWPIWFMPLVWFFSLSAVGLQVYEHFFEKTDGFSIRSTLGNVSVLITMGLVLAIFGEMEVVQLKSRIREDKKQGIHYQIYYWNLNRLIWNEWGLMSLAVHEKILPLLSEQEMSGAIQRGDLILARDTDRGKEMIEYAKIHFPELRPVQYPWHRWKTHASDGNGNSLIGKAWQEKDLSILWDHALILRFLPLTSATSEADLPKESSR